MKISNSKKQLAKIIHENGGWRDGAKSSAQCVNGEISFWSNTARKDRGEDWCGIYLGEKHDIDFTGVKISNWHQTILSRDEYFRLHPVAEAAPEPAGEAKPSIEQLAADYRNAKDYADRKQQEADAAKAGAETKLAELVAAGKALGLVLSVTDTGHELVINDWRELRVGDEVKAVVPNGGAVTDGETGFIVKIEDDGFWSNFPSQSQYWYYDKHFNRGDVVFIRRP